MLVSDPFSNLNLSSFLISLKYEYTDFMFSVFPFYAVINIFSPSFAVIFLFIVFYFFAWQPTRITPHLRWCHKSCVPHVHTLIPLPTLPTLPTLQTLQYYICNGSFLSPSLSLSLSFRSLLVSHPQFHSLATSYITYITILRILCGLQVYT